MVRQRQKASGGKIIDASARTSVPGADLYCEGVNNSYKRRI